MAFSYFLGNQFVDGLDERNQSLPVPVPKPTNAKRTMSLRNLIDRLAQIDGLIHRRATGTPAQMARKLGISRATWYELRDQLQHGLGLPITYDRKQQTYRYTRPGRLVIRFGEAPAVAAHPVDDDPAQEKNKF